MTANPFLSPLDALNRGNGDLETFHKPSTSTTTSADLLLEPLSKKQKLGDGAVAPADGVGVGGAGRKKPPWTPTEQAVVAIKHCELGNRWTQIAAFLPARSENDVKNIWHSTLRCKDTQKRSFLRTYALAVHDHAYDYATRKAMFDIAVRQCGPPPPQASEMIARVQLLMDHPELQAAVQQQQQLQQEQQLLQQHQQHQQDHLAQLTQLLQKREEMQNHQHLSHLSQLQLQHPHLMLLQHQLHGDDGDDGGVDMMEQGDATAADPRAAAASKLAVAKSLDKGMLDVRRLLQARDKYGSGKYDDAFPESYPSAAEDALAAELDQQRKHVAHLQVQGQGANALRNQPGSDSLEVTLRGNNSDSGVSVLRRYNSALGGQGSSGGGAAPAAAGGFSAAQNDALAGASALANMAAVAAAAAAAEQPPAGGGGGAAAAAAGADAPPGANRPPGVPLPGIGNLLALLYKYNTEQSQVTPKPLGTPGWPASGGEEEDGAAAAAAAAAGAGAPGPVGNGGGAAAGTTVAAGADVDDERAGAKASTTPSVPTVGPSSSQGPQSLALRPLSLRPLGQNKRERESDAEDEAAAAMDASPAGGDRSVEGSPKRPGSVRVAARRAQAAAAAAAAAAPPQPSLRDHGAAGGGGALWPRNSLPYTLEDADADELGAVEALALAARLNTSGGRTPGGGPSATGRSSTSNLAAAAAGGGANNSGGDAVAGRISGTGNAAALGSSGAAGLRNGAAAAAAAAPGARPGAVLDLHARQAPAAVSQPPPAPPQPPPPPQAVAPPRSLMRPHSSDLHSSSLQRQQQQQQRSASQTLDVISVLNMPGLRRQVLSLPSQTLVALLSSPVFGSDAEASVLLLVALWLQSNKDKVTFDQAKAVCGAVRLAALGGFYLSAVLPQLLTEPRVGATAVGGGKVTVAANARPGGRWFEMRNEELAFLTRYVHAGAAERALLVDVARGMYDCGSPWYDMTPRYLGSPAEGFCFEWHIPDQGLRDALTNGTQPHAAFTVNDDISDGGGADGGGGSVAVVPYILCRGLEWHVFVDCQQQRRGPGGAAGAGSSSVAGVFVYCRVPAALRAPGAAAGGFVGVVPGAGIRLGVHGWRCGRLEEVFVWTFGDETYFVPDAGMGCPSALPLRKRPSSPVGGAAAAGGGRGGGAAAADPATTAWADYLHEGGLRGTLTFLPH